MKVKVGALLGVRRQLGQQSLEMELPDGATIMDWMKTIKFPGGKSAFDLMIMENGEINRKYMILYNQVLIGDEMLHNPVREGDRLILLDYIYLPRMFVA